MEIPVLNNLNIQEPHPTYRIGVRRRTRQVKIGAVKVGGGAPISARTMTKTKTSDVDGTIAQIERAAEAGCDLVRVTVNDKEAALAMNEIVRRFQDLAWKLANNRTRSPDLRPDLANAALVELVRAVRSYRGPT